MSIHYEPPPHQWEGEENFHLRMARNCRRSALFWGERAAAWKEDFPEYSSMVTACLRRKKRDEKEAAEHDRSAARVAVVASHRTRLSPA